jgi:hypothetical protein
VLFALSPLASAVPMPWKSNDVAARFYQSMVQRSGNSAQTLNDLSAQQAARDAWDNMTPAQKQQQIAQSDAKFQAYAAQQQAKQQATPQATVASTVVSGLTDNVDPIFPAAAFHQMPTAWVGQLSGVQTVVASGNAPSNPNQGVVIVQTNGASGPTSSYQTPSATGPVKIISVNGNVITLQSQSGAWDSFSATGQATTVTNKGGVTYKFDVAKRAFVQ